MPEWGNGIQLHSVIKNVCAQYIVCDWMMESESFAVYFYISFSFDARSAMRHGFVGITMWGCPKNISKVIL